MGRDERRKNLDPFWLQEVMARLARIRVAKAARETHEVARQWGTDENVIELVLLRRRMRGECGDAESHGADPA